MKTLAYLAAAACLATLAACASTPPGDQGLQAYSPDEPAPAAAPAAPPAPAPVAAAPPAPVNVAAAKAILETNCAACHSPIVVTASHHSQGEWEDILEAMVSRGASLSEDEHKTLLAYLAANNGP